MLVQPPLEQLLPKVESRYTLAMLVAKRTRQLVDGAQPMVETDSPNLVTVACEEIAQDKVICVEGIFTPFVPLRPEIEEARRLARELAANQASLDSFPDLMDLPKATAEAAEDEIVDAIIADDTVDILDIADIVDAPDELSENTENVEEIVLVDDIIVEDSSESSETEE